MRKIIARFLCILFLISCDSGKSTMISPKSNTEYGEVIFYDLYRGFPKKSYRVIKNFEDYKAVFIGLNVDKVPQIDFTTQNVLVLNVGRNDNVMYSLEPEKIIEDGNNLIVVLRRNVFPKQMVDKKVTYLPITIVKIKSKKEIILK
ncbi:hypothetical protein [Flavobacterium luminosum]|uniref:Protease complex subunit PrcB family protein n=1 Tax=Flavobacterium luminosum TaxID=2949086 RepID=A0ABT0TLJ6_9FLAO|nr:hypothetical protein [Flavobacterium sp. HXWNR70]MCL9808374.1 hypothetical protein [Flavobacterium sp. HXWNR70]